MQEINITQTNEEILKELEEICGLKNCVDILRNYITFISLKKNNKIEFGTLNLYIRNPIEPEISEKLVDIIWRILKINEIIDSNYKYLTKEEIEDEVEERRRRSSNKDTKKRDEKDKKVKLTEELLVIDTKKLEGGFYSLDSDIKKLIKKYPKKIFIIIDSERYREWELEEFDNLISWELEISKFSKEDEGKYIVSFLKQNSIQLDDKCGVIDFLVSKPHNEIKKELLKIVIECKSKDIDVITPEIIKNIKDEKSYLKDIPILSENYGASFDSMVGVTKIKKQVNQITNYIKISKKKNKMPMLHMCFLGNPGTGKTTVARIVGDIFKEEKILSEKGKFVEVHGRDLIARYVGWTDKVVKEKIREAEGGVLFIDEAYSLTPKRQGGFEEEAIATLIKEMEDKRDNLCVILAGYTQEMDELLKSNPGFESRIQFKINFPDYSDDEMFEIFKRMAKKENYRISEAAKNLLKQQFVLEKLKDNFSNGRTVRNIFEKIKFEQADRVMNFNEDLSMIKKCDVEKVIDKYEVVKKEKVRIGFSA